MSQEFQLLNDLASDRNGGRIIFATDDFFAVAENLIQAEEPIWREGVYTPFGKWMDGWETRRRRKPGHDFCLIELAALTVIQGVTLNTAFFTGNYAPTISIQVAENIDPDAKIYTRCSEMGSQAPDEEVAMFANMTKDWITILGPVKMKPGYPQTCQNSFPIAYDKPARFLRFNLYPDGGIARLRVYGQVVPPIAVEEMTNLIAIGNGGECVKFSNAHFGHPRNLLSPKKSLSMADGWETARRLDRTPILEELPGGLLNHNGSEWCILKLGIPGIVKTIIVDTRHFLGNYPDRVQIEATSEDITDNTRWFTLVPFVKVSPNTTLELEVNSDAIFRFIRLVIQPDGGISRLRVLGHPIRQ